MPHDRMLATRHTYTWIHKYIFPGGLLPSVTAIEDSLARRTRLRITGPHDFGPHYARDAADLAGPVRSPAPTRSAGSASTRCSPACGPSTCATPRPASGPATSASASSPWPGYDRPETERRRLIADLVRTHSGAGPAGPAARLGRQRGRPGRAPVLIAKSPRALRADPVAPGRARPGPRLHQRRPRRGRRPRRRPAPGVGAPSVKTPGQPAGSARSRASPRTPPRALAACAPRPRLDLAAGPVAPAPAARLRAPDPRPPAQPGPRPGGDRRPLRRDRRVLPAHPGPQHGLLVRATGPATGRATLADAQRAKLELICAKLGLQPGSGCSTWAAAGAR